MKTLSLSAAALCVALSTANAATLDFEDLNPTPASFDVMPSPYTGFIFTGWYFGPDTLYAPASGVIDLFTDYADPGNPDVYVITVNNSISSASPFIFHGASFSGYSGVTFELYRSGSLVHTSATLPDAPDIDPYLPTFLASGYGLAVDTVKVSGVQGFYAMDDFQYEAAPVPEPATYAMLMMGLLAVGGMTKRRRT